MTYTTYNDIRIYYITISIAILRSHLHYTHNNNRVQQMGQVHLTSSKGTLREHHFGAWSHALSNNHLHNCKNVMRPNQFCSPRGRWTIHMNGCAFGVFLVFFVFLLRVFVVCFCCVFLLCFVIEHIVCQGLYMHVCCASHECCATHVITTNHTLSLSHTPTQNKQTNKHHRQPSIVDVSLFRIGSFIILCVPGEFTTMAGRRLKAAVRDAVCV